MKKKTVSLLLVAAITVGMLAGCGGGKSSISQDGSSDTADSSEKVERCRRNDNYILAFYGWCKWSGDRHTCKKIQ